MRTMTSSSGFNPFAMLMDPVSVLQAVQASATLSRLSARVFRPLELAGACAGTDAELAAFDAAVETEEGESGPPEV
jgi:hypothetical protein